MCVVLGELETGDVETFHCLYFLLNFLAEIGSHIGQCQSYSNPKL